LLLLLELQVPARAPSASHDAPHRACGFSELTRKILSIKLLPAKDDRFWGSILKPTATFSGVLSEEVQSESQAACKLYRAM
jgi:hypothetical protein